jgi:hypothetical protein
LNRLYRAIVGAVFFVAVSANAASHPDDDKLAPGDGAVLLTVSVVYPNAGNANAMMPNSIPQLTVEKLDESKPRPFILGNRLKGLQLTRAFAAALPPGRYRVSDVCSGSCGKVSRPAAADLPEFTVAAGQTSFLGTILVSIVLEADDKTWEAHWAWTDKPDLELGRRLQAGLYPELAKATNAVVPGWIPFAGDDAVASAREQIKFNESGMFEPSPYGPDGFFVGAPNGVIKRWNPVEGIKLIDTGSPYTLRSVVRIADGRMLVGGEATTLLYSEDDGRHWSDVSAGLPFGVIVQVKSIGKDEIVFSLLQEKSVSLYRGKLGDRTWTKLGDYPIQFAFWTGMGGVYPEMQVRGRTIALSLPSKHGIFLDLDSGNTHDIVPPGSIGLFSYSADGVMRCSCVRSIATNPWESHDQGLTWTGSNLDRFMVLPSFRNEHEGFTYKGAWLNADKAGVFTTSDGGQTWTKTAGPPFEGWWRPTYSADGSLMLLVGFARINRKVVEQASYSLDRGATWAAWKNEQQWLYPPLATSSN